MNAHSTPGHTDALVLRVLSGRQAGAEYRLVPGIAVSVGHGFQHDIVLRLPGARDVSMQLEIAAAAARLDIVSGAASLLGRPIAAGESAQLPFYVPLIIGDASFGIGSPDSERWMEAAHLQIGLTGDQPSEQNVADPQSAKASAPIEARSAMTAQIHGVAQHAGHVLRPFTEALALDRRWPVYAVIAATLLIAALLFNPLSSWVNQSYSGAPVTERALRSAGFADVTVQENPGGGLLFKGLVRNDAELTRLRRLISEREPAAVIDVNTIDGLASGVTDMLVAQGIDAEARPGRGKILVIDSEYLPSDRQEELIGQIRKDLPALTRILFHINAERGTPMLQYFFSSREYGIASFVDGDPAYISTANGDKWFKGAAVPTGHVITEIGNGRVRFERDGRVEELSFASEADVTAEDGDGTNEVNKAEVKERNTT